MRFDNTDKRFAIKISSLFLVLVVGIIANKVNPVIKSGNQDVINSENSKPSIIQTISIKKTDSKTTL
jgi:hypothetical protein